MYKLFLLLVGLCYSSLMHAFENLQILRHFDLHNKRWYFILIEHERGSEEVMIIIEDWV